MRLLLSSYSFFIKAPSAAVCKALISLVFYYHPYQSLAKSRLPLQIKEARDGARGPGDLGLRGPERSVDIELSSPGRARKKERYRFGIVLFSSARRGSKPFPPLQGFSNGLPVETLQRGEVDPSASLAIMFLSCQKLGSRRRRQYYPQLLRHET